MNPEGKLQLSSQRHHNLGGLSRGRTRLLGMNSAVGFAQVLPDFGWDVLDALF